MRLIGDPEHSDSGEQSRIKAILRFVSFALPLFVTILVSLFCWRRHFNEKSIESAGLAIGLCIYLAIFCFRRSRGLAAAFFYASNGPDRDESSQKQLDIVALWAAAIIVGTVAYMLFKHW